MTHLLAENAFLRAQVEQHARAEAELRAALRETMRAMPKAFTTGQGEDKNESVEAAPAAGNVTARMEERIASTIPAISPTNDAPAETAAAPIQVAPPTPVKIPVVVEPPTPIVPIILAPIPVVASESEVDLKAQAEEKAAQEKAAAEEAGKEKAQAEKTAQMKLEAEAQKAEQAKIKIEVAAEKVETPQPRREARPIVAPPLSQDDVYEPYRQPGQPVALQSAIHELSRRRVSRPLWKKMLGMR